MKDTTVNLEYFKIIDSNNKAYLLGFIAADGALVKGVNTSSTTLTLTIHRKDKIILDLLKRELNSSLAIKDITNKSKSLSSYKLDVDHVRFTISRKEIIQDLKKYGIEENKSLTMQNLLLNIPEAYKKAFIIGYFDGDGCFIDSLVTKKKHRYSKKDGSFMRTDEYLGYNSCVSIKGTEEFLKGIVEYLDIPTYTLKKIQEQKIHTLLIVSNKGILNFYDCYKDCDFYLSRKKDKFTRKIAQVQTISSPSA
jgi:hypothetical protein